MRCATPSTRARCWKATCNERCACAERRRRMTRLSVSELSIEFGSRRVVDRISFSIGEGERLGLVGESGSGKTVTALSLLRLVEAAHVTGEILFEGRDVLRMSA